MSAREFRLRKVWYYSSAIQSKLTDVQTCVGTLYEIAKAANIKSLEEIEKLLKEAYQHISEARRLAETAAKKIENELTGG
jgi:hypothetical protein